jgi:hypothetical protein
MGYNKFNLTLIHNVLNQNEIENILELGNQVINNKDFNTNETLGKTYFTKLGYNHTSVDWNGKDGALKIDLTKDIDDKYINKFDIVTNAGTTEHITNQFKVFQNLHKFGNDNCFYVNSLPLDTKQNQELYGMKTNPHGLYEYNARFFEKLCKLCNYEVVDINTKIATWPGNHFCNATYKKTKDSKFINEDEFNQILNKYTKFYPNGSNK